MENPPQTVFVGVSGASGAPYAARLVQALAAAGCRLQLCVSETGVLVLRHELELHSGTRAAVTGEFLELTGATAQVFAPDDLEALPASGSSCPDAVVVCPCSMSHGGAHRPRHQAPRSSTAPPTWRSRSGGRSCSSRERCRSRDPSAAPAGGSRRQARWCCRPCRGSTPARRRCQDVVDFVVGKVLSLLGFEQRPVPAVGRSRLVTASAGRAATGVDRDPPRIAAMFDGIAGRYDLMNRLMTAGLDGRWRRIAAARRPSLPATRRSTSAAAPATSLSAWPSPAPRLRVTGLDFSAGMLERARAKADARVRRGRPVPLDVRRRRPARAAVRRRPVRGRHRRLRRAQRPRPAGRLRRDDARHAPRRPCRLPRDHAAARTVRPALPRPLVRPRRAALGRLVAGDVVGLLLPAGLGARFPAADELAAIMARRRADARPLPALRPGHRRAARRRGARRKAPNAGRRARLALGGAAASHRARSASAWRSVSTSCALGVSGRARRGVRRHAQRRRQARAAAARAALRPSRPALASGRVRRPPPSSCCTWPRSCTTTSSTVPSCAAAGPPWRTSTGPPWPCRPATTCSPRPSRSSSRPARPARSTC